MLNVQFLCDGGRDSESHGSAKLKRGIDLDGALGWLDHTVCS